MCLQCVVYEIESSLHLCEEKSASPLTMDLEEADRNSYLYYSENKTLSPGNERTCRCSHGYTRLRKLLLKGQMCYWEDLKGMAFLCRPM